MTTHPERGHETPRGGLWRSLVIIGVAVGFLGLVVGVSAIVPWLSGGVSAAMPMTALLLAGAGAVIVLAGVGLRARDRHPPQ